MQETNFQYSGALKFVRLTPQYVSILFKYIERLRERRTTKEAQCDNQLTKKRDSLLASTILLFCKIF
jgi:hypothetical protein